MNEHRLGPADAGATVELAAGDRLVVALPEIPGSGYTWTVEDLPAGGRVIEERYEQRPGTGVGGESRHVFVLEPKSAGTLRLRHGQPWRSEEGVIDRYEVTAVVRP